MPFLQEGDIATYVIGPLPWGTSRGALIQLFQEWGWPAKPIQPSGRSADGKGLLWTAQAVRMPSTTVVSMQHGDVLILKKSQEVPQPSVIPKVEASVFTRQQLQKAGHGKDNGDPWAEAAKQLPHVRSQEANVAVQYMAKIEASLDKKLSERLGEDAVMATNLEPRVKELENQIKQSAASQSVGHCQSSDRALLGSQSLDHRWSGV